MAPRTLLLLLLALVLGAQAVLPQHAGRARMPQSLLRRAARVSRPPASGVHAALRAAAAAALPGVRVRPALFPGADPTGRNDSTPAILAALAACINVSQYTPGRFPSVRAKGSKHARKGPREGKES